MAGIGLLQPPITLHIVAILFIAYLLHMPIQPNDMAVTSQMNDPRCATTVHSTTEQHHLYTTA
jgi:hypothetical protein